MAKLDIYAEITNKIIEGIEAGTPAWRQPWTGGGAGSFPTRANGEYYKGINVLVLWMATEKFGFTSPHWMTFKQAIELGGAVQKGEKSTRVIYYGTIEREDQDNDAEKIPYIKTFAAFNASQIADLPAEYYPNEVHDFGTMLDANTMAKFEAFGVKIIESEKAEAFYSKNTDHIEMPPANTFYDQAGYYATLAHELCHATGHKSRLDRFSKKTPYAFEELVAEIGNCMVCARLGLTPNFGQSSAYVEHWLETFHADKKAIFRAASQAQKACDYIMDRIKSDPQQECA